MMMKMGTELLDELVRRCSGNAICIVEGFKLLLDSGYSPSENEIKYISALMGEPTKRLNVMKSKYFDVFTRFLEKNCYLLGGRSVCIYSWNPRVPVRYFPVSLDATGTIIAIDGSEVSLIAYPAHRTHDVESRGVDIPDPGNMKIAEVTSRVDGYQITFYFNPLLNRWIPATRYALHNMRYVKGRVITEDFGSVINPFAAAADHIARSKGLYERIKDRKGWTFTFVLELTEPAILKPNIDLHDPESFKLYLVNARSPDGRILTTSESSRLVNWEPVPVEKVNIDTMPELRKFIEFWSRDIQYRSRFIRYLSTDPVRPYVIEVKSKLYENAVLVKYTSDPKSIIVLASYGLGDKAVELLTDYKDIRKIGKEICELHQALRSIISETLSTPILEELMKEWRLPKELFGELEKARRTGDPERLARKLSLALSEESIYDTREKLKTFVEVLKERGKAE